MLARDLLRQRQAQAAAFGAAAHQRQEHAFGQFLGHAAAVVDDLQAQRERDAARRRCARRARRACAG